MKGTLSYSLSFPNIDLWGDEEVVLWNLLRLFVGHDERATAPHVWGGNCSILPTSSSRAQLPVNSRHCLLAKWQLYVHTSNYSYFFQVKSQTRAPGDTSWPYCLSSRTKSSGAAWWSFGTIPLPYDFVQDNGCTRRDVERILAAQHGDFEQIVQ